MPVRLFKTPGLVQSLLPGLTWRGPRQHQVIYLTFDDGPIPEVTEFVLNELQQYQAKATFFCVGDNLQKHPAVATKVAAAGHVLANHTQNHLRGRTTPAPEYLANINACDKALEQITGNQFKKLFRAPYGSFTRQQYKLIKPDYQLIMWEVLTYDFDAALAPEICLAKAIKNTRAGSIVVFHDSLKARRNLEFVLPRYLAHFQALGYRFEAL